MTGLALNGDNFDPTKQGKPVNGSMDLLLPRRIAFQPARKPFDPSPGGDFKLETLNPVLNPQKPSLNPSLSVHVVKKSEVADVLDHSLDPELTLGIGFKRIGAGLANLGNTCFLNSVLQCLTYTEPLAAYLQSGKHKSSCHAAGFCAMCAIQNHVRSALQSSGKILSPSYLVRNLRSICHNFRNSRQEDAHEYMVSLMESMHKCCLPSGVSTQSASAYEKSLVHKIFGGRLRSQVKCTQCSYCSNTFDPFLDLSLQIVKADSLPKALAQFTAVEQLDGGEKQYQCAQCKEKVRALKQLTVHRAPYVLTIHLKRFGSGVPGQKIDKKVEFGTVLNLKPYVSGPYEGELKYSLYGVLVHAGWSTHSGHYYCFVRTSSGIWHVLDDNRVNQVSEKYVMEQKAYMLFYVLDKKSFPAKKSFDMSHKVNKAGTIVQNGVIPTPLCKAMENNSNHTTGMSNGTVVPASIMTKEAPLPNGNGCSISASNILGNSKDEYVNLLNVKSSPAASSGCSQQSAQSKNASIVDNVSLRDSVDDKLDNAKTVIVHSSGFGTSNNWISKQGKQDRKELSTILHNSSCQLDATKSHTKSINNPDTTGTVISQKIDLENSAIIPNGLSIFHRPLKNLPKENGIVHEQSDKDYDKMKIMASKPDSVQKLVSASNGCNVSTDGASKKSILDNPLPGRQIGGSRLGIPSHLLSRLTKQNQSAWSEQTETDVSIKAKLPVENGCVQESPKKQRIGSIIFDQGKNMARHHRKRKYLHPMPISRGRMFFMSLRVGQDYNPKHKRHKGENLVEDIVKEPKARRQNVAVEQTNSDTVHAESISHQIAVIKENGHANATEREPYVNDSRGSKRKADGERKNQINGVLATSIISETKVAGDLTCVIEANKQHTGAVQNNFAELLSRGLSLVTVPRWDDIEAVESHEVGRFKGKQLTSIGYVLDEWDEEYDKGKRKKTRKSKYIDGAENPFQEIATKKAKSKHTTLKQMRSGHQPLRI